MLNKLKSYQSWVTSSIFNEQRNTKKKKKEFKYTPLVKHQWLSFYILIFSVLLFFIYYKYFGKLGSFIKRDKKFKQISKLLRN